MSESGVPAVTSFRSVLCDQALRFADKNAYAWLGDGATERSLTYAQLQAAVWRLGSVLIAAVPRQSRVLILLPQDLSFIEAFLSCAVAGMVAVPMYLPSNAKRVAKAQGIFTDADPRAILWSRSCTPNLRRDLQAAHVCEDAIWIDLDEVPDVTGRVLSDSDVDGEELAMLQYTSGSTGDPKGVMLSHRNLLANQEMIRDAFGHTDRSIILGCLPFYHDMGLIGNLLQPLFVGATCILLPAQQVVRQPLSWLRNISKYRATTSGGPNSFYDLCIHRIEAADLGDLDLSCWEVAFNGSEPIKSATLDAFVRRFAQHGFRRSAFLPVYGLAEASLLVCGRRKAATASLVSLDRSEYENSRIRFQKANQTRPPVQLVGCGLPAIGVDIRIAGQDGRALAECEIGEILLRSASVARGYWNCKSAEVFAAKLAGRQDERYLSTGDQGFIFDGELFVTGRAKESMIVGGRNYYPADIETTVSSACDAPADARNAVFSVNVTGNEEIVVVQEIESKVAGDYEEVRRAIARQCWLEHQIHLLNVVFVRAGSVPRTTSGKTRRLLTRQMYIEGRWSELSGPRRSAASDAGVRDIRACLLGVLRRHFPNQAERIHAHVSLSDLGLDSYTVVRVSEDIGAALGVHVPLMEFIKQITVAELAERIAANRSSFAAARKATVATRTQMPPSRIPQTHGQIALWNRQKLSHGAALNVFRALRVRGRLEWARFETAVARVMSHCDVLRMELREEEGEFVHVFVPERKPSIEYVDAVEWSGSRVAKFLEDRANEKLDIANGLTWHWVLLDTADGSIVLFIFHHIICDLETVALLIEALFSACAAESLDRFAPAQSYGAYVQRQHEFILSDAGRDAGRLWADLLKDVDLRVDLLSRKSPGKNRYAAQGGDAELRKFVLDESATGELSRKCVRINVGLNALLLAAFAMVLKGYTQQKTIAIGTPVSARTSAGWRRTPGYMINVLPIVIDFAAAQSLEEMVRQVGARTLTALEHRDYPLPLIVQYSRRARPEGMHEPNAMNVVFAYHQARLLDGRDVTAVAMNEAASLPSVGNLELRTQPVRMRDVDFPVLMTVGLIAGELTIHLQWDGQTMYEDVMTGLLAQYGELLSEAVAADDLKTLRWQRSAAFAV